MRATVSLRFLLAQERTVRLLVAAAPGVQITLVQPPFNGWERERRLRLHQCLVSNNVQWISLTAFGSGAARAGAATATAMAMSVNFILSVRVFVGMFWKKLVKGVGERLEVQSARCKREEVFMIASCEHSFDLTSSVRFSLVRQERLLRGRNDRTLGQISRC